jgi:anti-sigma factor RsiW
MSEHVTVEQIEQYRGKGMPAEDLVAFDRHVAQCGECRSRLASEELVMALLAGLESAAAAPEHLSYDQMTAYADAKSDEVDREIVESHVELCARCAAELGDLAAFAQMMSAETEPGPMESQRVGLGEISLPRKVKIRAGDGEETKER